MAHALSLPCYLLPRSPKEERKEENSEAPKSATVLSFSFGIRPGSRLSKAGTQSRTSLKETRCFFESEKLFFSCPDVTQSTCHCCNSCRSTWDVLWKTQHARAAHIKYETFTAWNVRFVNINAISSLRNCIFNYLSVQFYWLACAVPVIAYFFWHTIFIR